MKKIDLIDERDREYADAQRDPALRDAIVCAVTTYRRPDRLKVDDPVPELELTRLSGGPSVSLAARRTRPLVLFFGSYT